MSGKRVIEVDRLSKYYRLGSIGGATLREDLARWWARVRGRPDPCTLVDEGPRPTDAAGGFWALRDVSFAVREGEVLGIIGRNGAGKSTLLKLLSRITAPTSGRALIRGRVGSLLEVGTGFHPELTGRENIYLNGAILGMTRAEITRKLDEIIAFAEMAKFIDTPVKRYSSGMTVRLAFAVAAHLEPEILIVDEVLAVGDVDFQRKCIGKMKDVSRQGRTVLFVSHNLQAIRSLCTHGIVIRAGVAGPVGTADAAVRDYLHGDGASAAPEWTGALAAPNRELVLERIVVRNEPRAAARGGVLSSRYPIVVEFELRLESYARGLCIGFDLLGDGGEVILRSYDTDVDERLLAAAELPARVRVACTIPGGLLNAGSFRIAPRVGIHNIAWLIHADPLVDFEVALEHGQTVYWVGLTADARPGSVAPLLPWALCETRAAPDPPRPG